MCPRRRNVEPPIALCASSATQRDWSGDFFDFSLRRWLSAKLEAVIHGHGQAAGSRAGAGGRGHFDDHLGFDRPQHRSTAEFAVVEVDDLQTHSGLKVLEVRAITRPSGLAAGEVNYDTMGRRPRQCLGGPNA